MDTKRKNRRQFIKLASGLLATPFVSLAAGNVYSADTEPPLRLLTIVDSYGLPIATRNEAWVNSTAGDYALTGDELGTTLAPLQAYKENMLIVSGINLDSLIQTRDGPHHDEMNSQVLCGSRRVSGTSRVTAKTLHSSLDVHVGQYLNSDYGLARAYPHLFFTDSSANARATTCYDASGNQIRSIAGARNQANNIFTSGVDAANLQYQNKTQQGIFDLVQQQIQALRGQLINANASTVMDAYQSSIDDLAMQLESSSRNVCGVPGGDLNALPGATGGQAVNSSPYIFKNISQAFACDLTSSLTYAIGSEIVNNFKHGFLYSETEHADTELQTSLNTNLHGISHRTDDVTNKAHELIRIYQAELLADLLNDMSNTADVDGNTVLDNTVIFWTPVMSHNTHKYRDYPYLVIAGKNTNLKGGFHYDCGGSTNNDLLTTIAQGVGLPDDRFGGHNRHGEYLDTLNNGPISKMLVG